MAVLGQVATEAFPQLTITQSQTWVPPQDGVVCIHVVGAGSAGLGGNLNHGGGAGAYAKIPTLAVTTSGSYTLVVGVGGEGTYGNFISGAGGASSIAGTNLTGTKTCGGGASATSSLNGAGGTLSGSGEGWAGYTGGAGAVSGGAVGVFATGNSGSLRITDAAAGGLAMSGYGIICGGSLIYTHQYLTMSTDLAYPITAGDLCGGANLSNVPSTGYAYAGGGGIGGGGGAAAGGSIYQAWGGRGGDGIILIQYLPW